MKKTKVILLILCLIAATAMTSCTRGKGEVISKTFVTESFTGVTNDISADVHITCSPTQSVEIVAQSNIIDNISLKVINKVLVIEFIKKNVRHYKPININISMPELSSLTIDGSGNMDVANTFDSCANVSLTINGSGNMSASLHSNASVFSSINGSGNISLSGSSPYGEITINGSGNYNAFPFQTKDAMVNILGSGNCEVSVSNLLKVLIAGSGNVYYKGHPTITQTITGSGVVIDAN